MQEKLVRPPTRERVSPNLPDLIEFFDIAPPSEPSRAHFNQALEIREFRLGDELCSYDTSAQSNSSVQHEQNAANLYLICQGRVRLLGFDGARGREVSTLVLEAGESFGTETMFAHISSPTRAIAASEGQIARIGGDCLQSLLEQLPQLEEQLRATACDRERLIFLKTATDWRHRPGRQLRQLLPYLEEVEIPAGEALAHCAPDGHFWLRSGEIRKGERTSAVVGESWGYPDPPPADWIAQTDLQVYKLPKERWDAIAPTNTAERTAPAASNGHHPHGSKGKLPATAKQEDSKSQSPPSDSSSQTIAFPKPTPLSRLGRQLWRRYPYVEQQSSSDCGAACLAMVGRYWGKQLSLNYLRNLAGVGRGGASLQALAKAADNLGFQARPVRASLSRLANQDNPWIAHWQGEHYVVVYWVKGDRVLVADPAKGKHTLPRQEFLSGWTGYGLLLDPTERLNAAPEQKLSLSRYWKALLPYRSLIGQILVVSLLIQVFGLARPLFTQIILDKVVVNQSFASLHVFAVGLLLFGIWSLGLKGVRRYLLDYLSNRLDLTLIGGFINHTLRLPLKFFESRRVGDIITRVQENQKIQRFLIRQVVLAWLDLMMGAVYIGLMLYYNLRLTLLILALVPPIAILTLVSTPFLRRVSRDIFNKMAEQNSLLVEMLTGTSTVKAAAAEREIRWQWEDRFTSSINARFRGQKLSNGLQIASGAINTLGSTALLWYGASLVIQGDLTIGQFVAFNMMIGRVISPFLALAKLWDELQEVFISVERLNDVFETEPEEASDKPMLVLPPLRGEVRFDDVTFRYDEEQERNTLQNISFEVHPGETAAIVGRSGSGKTTLVSLLQGLYHPNSGRIWVDGHDIRHVSPQSLRSQLGVVPQDCFLFSGTILDNIRLYRPEFTLEEVTEVAKLAEAHSFIQNLPLGYNTKVGERGSSLSGGQRQRIAIARALLGEPRILVLDEATSSLDTESERRFQQNLERLSRDRTTFIIAHRLSTVRNADTIIVLDRGVLVERGTHEELMALQGLYYHLAQQQLNL